MRPYITLLALPLISSTAIHVQNSHGHAHNFPRHIQGTWYHRDDHHVNALFKRVGATDGVTYAAIGSDAWVKAYPAGPPESPDPNAMPSEWLAALNDAVARKAIPAIPVATSHPDTGIPTYPAGFDPNGPQVCSATYGCRIDGDVWDAPNGHVALSFDDGPLPPTDGLLEFLDTQNGQTVTHFMIGSNIIEQPEQFQKAFNRGDDIAVHTWTHPYMTTKSNEQVVAELGWTIELIHNSTGGRVPRFWRPPYGDSDVRTSAIAREVFGLTTVIWNQDTADWSLDASPPGTSLHAINASMNTWLTGSKTPGLIILEHELSDDSVGAFKAAYPVMQAHGWTLASLATLLGNGSVYQNAANDGSAVRLVSDILDAKTAGVPVSSASASAGATASAGGSVAAGAGATASGANLELKDEETQHSAIQLQQSITGYAPYYF
ncbi:carbohydrate esterase family 4 protein [Mycena pura]|uniref:chitin deacetylase n=1 Tax=Mycena pura TaxID=153505 RepID=A0AAD6YDV6_9AGAR|nr:carbohydrate esterase family 4 protein [Mycena pura]